MLLAAPLGENPRDVAGRLGAELERRARRRERQRRADRGRRPRLRQPLPRRRLVPAGDGAPGRAPARASARRRPSRPERILVEFVSANPTGPLHVGGGRHAAYGDALVRLLEAVGHEVEREYYVNDGGGQVERFALSIAARMTGGEPPEDGYSGEYVAELAEQIAAEGIDPADTEAVGSARRRAGPRARARHPRPLRRPLRHLVLRARPLPPGRGRGGAGPARAGRPLLPQRGRALAAHDRVRRRQGPGPDPRQRRADLPGRRRRLPLGQARARLRPPDRRARRRPPRLRAAGARGDRRRSAPTRTASRR